MSDFPSDEMVSTPDPIDQASKLSEGERSRNEAVIRNRAAPKQKQNEDGSWPVLDCEDCGMPIGLGRIEAIGAVTCIACAEAADHRTHQFMRRR